METLVIGTGYVGLVTGACLADLGCKVTCVDTNKDKIAMLLNSEIPIYEPGLKEVVQRNQAAELLSFSVDIEASIKKSDVIFLAVGTPSDEQNGSADLSYIFKAVDMIAANLTKDCVVVVKLTVPVGTAAKIKQMFVQKAPQYEVNVVSNPEFLREGSAVKDFMEPDRIIVGTNSGKARETMRRLYWNLIDRDVPIVFTDVQTSELIKYAANAFLAVKIAFINEMADLCEQTHSNIEDVAKGMGMDQRIGAKYLLPGPGFGGSCFPKDTLALGFMARQAGVPSKIVESVIASNNNRKKSMADKILKAYGSDIKGKQVAILGTAFKANTDDMRYSASIDIIQRLHAEGAVIKAYDPVAMEEAQTIFSDINIQWCESSNDALNGAELAAIITEWDEFKELDLASIKTIMNRPLIVDLRNLYAPSVMQKHGFEYVSVGREPVESEHLSSEKDQKVVLA
ncbi:MAG: UDP-glucose/GDP-mannose dehydrogenase family protein [Rickettsiales bacterium]|nr:UDP-glucose/GDP-mannose dehydrogenase family protein [Rickettsiales bacterium]